MVVLLLPLQTDSLLDIFIFEKLCYQRWLLLKLPRTRLFFYRNLMQIGFCYGGYMEKFSEF